MWASLLARIAPCPHGEADRDRRLRSDEEFRPRVLFWHGDIDLTGHTVKSNLSGLFGEDR